MEDFVTGGGNGGVSDTVDEDKYCALWRCIVSPAMKCVCGTGDGVFLHR